MFEYMMRGIAGEKFVHLNEKYAIDNILKHCRPGRLETFSTIWGINEEMRRKSHDLTARRKILDAEWAEHQAQLKTISNESVIYTDKSQMQI